ncbi:SusD family protein [bacterium A37T11]|nr:SusD family protein [bacterium A37T11]
MKITKIITVTQFVTIIGISTLLSVSCSKYLSEIPDDRTTINSDEKVELLLASAYEGTTHYDITESMSDNVEDEGKKNHFQRINDLAYKWEVNNIDQDEDSPLGYWVGCYKSIAVANQALASISQLGDRPEDLPSRGEALLIRAYYHFMLVNLWAKQYNPQTAATDPGIPYVTEPEEEPFKKYTRNTVQEVYDFIEKDLLEGLELVGSNYASPKFRFTPESGKAFATRFYLNKGGNDSWAKIIQYASELLTSPSTQLRDWSVAYKSLSSDALEIQYSSPDEPANIMVGASPSYYARYYAGSPGQFDLTQHLINALFNAPRPVSNSWAYKTYSYEIGGNQFVPKYTEHFVYTNQAAGIGNGFLQHVIFAYDEVLLNRAEAYAMVGNFEAARADLAIFYEKKTSGYNRVTTPLTEEAIQKAFPAKENELSPYYTMTAQQKVYVKCIAEAKRMEYLHEGLRWFEIRRLNLEVKHLILPQDNMILKKDDPRRELQIPAAAQESGLKPNVR